MKQITILMTGFGLLLITEFSRAKYLLVDIGDDVEDGFRPINVDGLDFSDNAKDPKVEPDNCTVNGKMCGYTDTPCCEGLSCKPHPDGLKIRICVPTSSEEVVHPEPAKCPLCCVADIACREGEAELCKDPTICPELNPNGTNAPDDFVVYDYDETCNDYKEEANYIHRIKNCIRGAHKYCLKEGAERPDFTEWPEPKDDWQSGCLRARKTDPFGNRYWQCYWNPAVDGERNDNAQPICLLKDAKDLPPGTGEEYSKCGGICCNKTCLGPCWPCKEGLKCVGEIDSDGNGQGLCLKECNGHGIDWNCPVERPYCINETCVSAESNSTEVDSNSTEVDSISTEVVGVLPDSNAREIVDVLPAARDFAPLKCKKNSDCPKDMKCARGLCRRVRRCQKEGQVCRRMGPRCCKGLMCKRGKCVRPGLSTKECKCGKCCKGPDGEATDDLCPDGYECSKNPKFICYGSCLKVDSKAKSGRMRHYVPNARTHCFPPANFPFIGFGPFETANDVKSKCDNTPNCYMFYRNNDRQYYTCPPKATVGEKLGFTLFTAVTVAKMAVDDASKLSGNGGFGGKDGMVGMPAPGHLSVVGWKLCLGMMTVGTAEFVCFPAMKPEKCAMSAWKQLWSLKDRPDRCDDHERNTVMPGPKPRPTRKPKPSPKSIGISVCELPMAPGRCLAAKPRVYFDSSDGQCKDFIYGGCEGNANNFRNKEECEELCGGGGMMAELEQSLL